MLIKECSITIYIGGKSRIITQVGNENIKNTKLSKLSVFISHLRHYIYYISISISISISIYLSICLSIYDILLAQKKLPKWLRNICLIKKCVFSDFENIAPHIVVTTALKKIYIYRRSNRLIRQWVQFAIKANFVKLLQFHLFVQCSNFILVIVFVSRHICFDQNLAQVITLVTKWIDTYGIHHWRIFKSIRRK